MLKRGFDIIFSALGILLLSPLLLVVSVLVKLDSPGPIFFRQTRVGKDGRLFQLIKFRTMVDVPEESCPQFSLGDESRVTKTGRFLRCSKIDELPQLINVLKGEMSLVGPRPEVPKYINYYTPEQKKVLQVKPGITDFASIKFRSESLILKGSKDPEKEYTMVILPEKLRLNLEYMEKMSLFLDIKLIFQTIIRTIHPK